MSIVPTFELLDREECQASIMLEGLTGNGKSGLALMLAYGLVGGFIPHEEGAEQIDPAERWKKIFATDAENRSLNLFIGIPASWGGKFGRFYGAQLTSEDGYAPSNYLTLRDAAVKRGALVSISDSITHMWTAKGGVLDLVAQAKSRDAKLDNYRVWGLPEIAAEKQKLIDVIRDSRCHVITTVRVKEKFDMQYNNATGKNEVVSLGEQQLQQDGLKYEPDLVLQMVEAGSGNPPKHPVAKVIKSRYAIFTKGETYEFTPELCEQLRVYLADGEDPAVLLERQRVEYVEAVKAILDRNPSARAIWPTLKTDAGHADTKLEDLPLNALKQLYSQIIV